MAWSHGPGAGFTTGQPWLRIGSDAASHNVAAEEADVNSVLAAYRRLIRARRESPALHGGTFRRLDVGEADVLAWVRESGADRAVVMVNFAGDPRTARLPAGEMPGRWRPLAGTHLDPPAPTDDRGELSLRGLEGIILVPA
jgi:alpha-glucosidase